MEPFTLTRYLYIKQDVNASLLVAILEKDATQAIFWAHELYFSGFEKEVTEYLYGIYINIFYVYNPRLKKLMDICMFRYHPDPHILETIILNLTAQPRRFSLQAFMCRNECLAEPSPDAFEKETPIFIFSKLDGSCFHENSRIPVDKVLQRRCLYSTDKTIMNVFGILFSEQFNIHEEHRMYWEYYAAFSPVWKKRIEEYHGTVNHDTKRIDFENDDYLESFYEEYGYDLDEQPTALFMKLMHYGPDPQISEIDFYKKYDPEARTKMRKIRKNILLQRSKQTEHHPIAHP